MAAAGVTYNYDAVDHRAIGGCAVAAVVYSGGEVEWQTGCEGRHAAEVDLPGQGVDAAEHESMALVEDRIAIFDAPGEVRVIRILARYIGVDVVGRMRPGIAREHRQAMAEAMRQVHVERVVVGVAIVHVALDEGVGRLRIRRGDSVAGQAVLAVPGDPIGPRAVGGLRGADLAGGRADERGWGVDIARAIDARGMRADIIHAEDPIGFQTALDSEAPLLGVRVQ